METPTNPPSKKSKLKPIILLTLLAIAGYFGYQKIHFLFTHESTDNAQIETQIMPVLPRVAGYVKNILVKDYDSVATGQLLVELDDAELQTQLAEQEADLQQSISEVSYANANKSTAIVSLQTNKGAINLQSIRLKKAQQDADRDDQLFKEEAITRKQWEDSRYNLQAAQQQLTNSETEYSAANNRILVQTAAVDKATSVLAIKRAKIEQTRLKLSYTKITAPQTGKIGKKNVAAGQYVQAGTPLFSIVNDTTYWVIANFKENQLLKLYPGKEVELSMDAYPQLKLTGTIESLSEATGAKFSLLPPDNASGNFVKVTQRVPVKIKIKEVEKYRSFLRAGLSVEVTAEIK
jgi:membrane fusion protein, multidrug efflux system